MSSPAPPIAVLTRPQGLNEALARALSDDGWGVTIAPALQIKPHELGTGERVPSPADFDLIVFVSGNAVAGYASQLDDDFDWPDSTSAACVGIATAQSVRENFGATRKVLHPAANDIQDSESLWQVISAQASLPRRVLILRGQDGRDWLAEQFRARGVSVHVHVAYCREPATWSTALKNQIAKWIATHTQVTWLITSQHGIQSVTDQLERAGWSDWASRCSFIVTHPRLVEPLRQQLGAGGASTCIELARGDLASLVSCFQKIRQNLHQN